MNNSFTGSLAFGPILLGVVVLVVSMLGLNYLRAEYYMKDDMRTYVRANMPSNLSDDERQKKSAQLAMEFSGQPMQMALTFSTTAFSFFLAGFLTGRQSNGHANAITVAILGVLFFTQGEFNWTSLLLIAMGLPGAVIGSMLAKPKKAIESAG